MSIIPAPPDTVQAQQDISAVFPIAVKATKTVEDEQAYEAFVEVWQQQLEQNWQCGYTQMPDEIRHDPTLSPRAKIVYEALLGFMWFKSDKCWPSQATLAEATGYSRSTVIRALKDLYERGYIERWRRGQGDTNYYFINPLSFVRSFRPAGRGCGVRLQVRALHETTMENPPAPRFPLLLSEKFQPATSKSSNVEHSGVSDCNTNHTKTEQTQRCSIDSNLSIPPSGVVEVGCAAIGNVNEKPDSSPTTEGTNQPPTMHTESKTNPIETKKEDRRGAGRAKEVLVSKMGKSYNGVEVLASTTGIPAEHLAELGVALERKKRPIPDFIERIMTDFSRDLGDSPRAVKSNITRATKIYYTACQIFTDIQDDPEGHFLRLLYDARAGALKIANVKHHTGTRTNRIPAFFACLENIFEFTPDELAYLRSDEPLYAPEKAS